MMITFFPNRCSCFFFPRRCSWSTSFSCASWSLRTSNRALGKKWSIIASSCNSWSSSTARIRGRGTSWRRSFTEYMENSLDFVHSSESKSTISYSSKISIVIHVEGHLAISNNSLLSLYFFALDSSTKLSTSTALESCSRSSGASLMASHCHWRLSISNSWSRSWYRFTKFAVCPSIMLSWPTALFNS